eukprot:1751711-Prorocentrum_lima.AAC.1
MAKTLPSQLLLLLVHGLQVQGAPDQTPFKPLSPCKPVPPPTPTPPNHHSLLCPSDSHPFRMELHSPPVTDWSGGWRDWVWAR